MDLFGFDDLVEGPSSLPFEKVWCDPRLFSAFEASYTFFRVLPSIKARAIALVHQWKREVSHFNQHVLVGLGYMHACAEFSGGSCVFPTEVCRFANEHKQGKLIKYGGVIAAYEKVCNKTGVPRLLVHTESAIRRIIGEGTTLSDGLCLERAVKVSLAIHSLVTKWQTETTSCEVLICACVLLALRALDERGYTRKTLSGVALLPPKSNSVDLWAKKIAHGPLARFGLLPTGRQRPPHKGIGKQLQQSHEEIVTHDNQSTGIKRATSKKLPDVLEPGDDILALLLGEFTD